MRSLEPLCDQVNLQCPSPGLSLPPLPSLFKLTKSTIMRPDPLKKTPRKTKRFSQQRTAAPEKGVYREEKQTRQCEKDVYRGEKQTWHEECLHFVGLEHRTRKTTILAQPLSITGVLGTLPSVMSRTQSRNGEYSLYFEKLCAGECRLRTRRYSDSEK